MGWTYCFGKVIEVTNSAQTRMNLRDFYKCQYELEIARKTDLTAALSIPLGVFSLLIGALVLIAKDLHAPLSNWECFTLGFVVAAAAGCVVVAVYLFKAHTTFEYSFLPTAMKLREYHSDLVTFYLQVGHSQEAAESAAEADTLEYISEQHAINATHNSRNNDRKSGYQFLANQALMVAVALASCAGVLYVINSVASSAPAHRVEVIKFNGDLSNGVTNSPQSAASTAGTSSATNAPTKPADPGGLPATVSPSASPAASTIGQ